MAAQTAQAPGLPLPWQLSDAQVLLGGTPIALFYASSNQVNALIPESASGLVKLGIQNTGGSHTVNLLVEAAVPAIFTQDQSGKGAAAALNAKNNVLVTSGNPVHAGEYLELFLTGLGLTTNQNGLDFANQQPTVAISGKDCPVTYAGRAPGFSRLDQINCVVPGSVRRCGHKRYVGESHQQCGDGCGSVSGGCNRGVPDRTVSRVSGRIAAICDCCILPWNVPAVAISESPETRSHRPVDIVDVTLDLVNSHRSA